MMTKRPKRHPTQVRFEEDAYAALVAEAEAEGRSVSDVIRRIVDDWIKRKSKEKRDGGKRRDDRVA
jgi:predicted CopG family antitoxin